MKYNWQKNDWPVFHYDITGMTEDLLRFADMSGQISGATKAMPENSMTEAYLDVMISEAIKTSLIEGESLRRPDVASSIRNQLGLNDKPEPVRDLAASGIAELMVSLRNNWNEPLTDKMLFAWQEMILKGQRSIDIGCWRSHEEPMQVVKGSLEKQTVLFEAPPSSMVPNEMNRFIDWFNKSRVEISHAPIRAAIAHLYFESIHPFEDGNGRIGRAISEKALSEGLGRPLLLSLSKAIESDKYAYYEALGSAQKQDTITEWIAYFLKTVLQAQIDTNELIDFIIQKTKFIGHWTTKVTERQLKVLLRMLKEGPKGFEGGMTAGKYAGIAKVSKATATRDLQTLVKLGALIPLGGGRSTHYSIKLQDPD